MGTGENGIEDYKDIQAPLKTAPGGVPARQQHIQTLIADDQRIRSLLNQSLYKAAAALVRIRTPLVLPRHRIPERPTDSFVNEAMARPAGVAELFAVHEPVERPQAAAVGEVFLRRVEGGGKVGFLAGYLAPVGVGDGVAKEEEHGGVKGEPEAQWLEVHVSVFGDGIDEILDAFLDLVEILGSVRGELGAQQVP